MSNRELITSSWSLSCDPKLTLQTEMEQETLCHINPKKSASRDDIPGLVLKACAAQLTGIYTILFNPSSSQAVAPTWLKSGTVLYL